MSNMKRASRLLTFLGMSLIECRGAHSIAASDSLAGTLSHFRRVYVSEFRHGVKSTFLNIGDDPKNKPIISNLCGSSSFACNIEVGKHTSFCDLKVAEDGADMGPSPKELCYSALGSCTVMTMRTFFENTKAMKGSSWAQSNLINISVMLDEVKGNHAHVPEGINIFVDFEGDLNESQKERLLRAANNCPVKQMMSGGLNINTVALSS